MKKRRGDRFPFVAFVCFVASFPSILAAQEPPRPQFETRAELVLVDVNVVDREGQPVSDLNETDFEIEINGQPRTIQSVQFVSTVPDPSITPSLREAAFSSNEAPTSGRLLLFVVDEGNMRMGSARAVLRTAQMLMDRLAPGDLVGLARLPTGAGGVEFTTDRERIRTALQRVTGSVGSRIAGSNLRISEASAFESGDQVSWQQAIDRECAGESGLGLEACIENLQGDARGMIMDVGARTRATFQALESLFERLRSLDAPVTVVMISEGLYVGRDRQNMTTLARRAAEARATMHIVRPHQTFFDIEDRTAPGLGSFFDDGLLSEGLEQLAAQTRGTLSQVTTGSGETVFERLGRELAGYYLIGFEPTEVDRTGRERRIRVRVGRRDLRVRARPMFVIREPTRSAAAAAEAGTTTGLIKQLLGAPLPTRGLPMRVASFTATSTSESRVRVIIAAEIGDPATEAVEWPIGLLVIDKDDKVVASSLDPAALAPASAIQPSPRLLLTSVLLEPGQYTLRLAAIGPDGRSGSVHHSIDARFKRGPRKLEISDLLLVPAQLGAAAIPRLTPSAIIETETIQAMIEMMGSDEPAFSRARVRVHVASADTSESALSSGTGRCPGDDARGGGRRR
ncbi:MAG: VWA domain-containing protein [Acidobacteria bacterium]|nr:VWA domain-containing protein [Acidobacteriota bacterium]